MRSISLIAAALAGTCWSMPALAQTASASSVEAELSAMTAEQRDTYAAEKRAFEATQTKAVVDAALEAFKAANPIPTIPAPEVTKAEMDEVKFVVTGLAWQWQTEGETDNEVQLTRHSARLILRRQLTWDWLFAQKKE